MQTENIHVATKAMALAAQASDLDHTESAHSNLTNSDALHDTRKALALDLTRAGTDNSGNVEFQTAPTTEHATLDSLSHSGSVVTDASLALSNAPLTPSHMTSKMLKSPAPTLSMNKAVSFIVGPHDVPRTRARSHMRTHMNKQKHRVVDTCVYRHGDWRQHVWWYNTMASIIR